MIEFINNQKDLCLSWDATGLNGAHFNEVHVTANVTQHIYVDVNKVVGGKAEDYVDQIMSAFSVAAAAYARFQNQEEYAAEILAAIYNLQEYFSHINRLGSKEPQDW